MHVLVTGGAGYIGAHVVAALRERGDEVVVVDDLRTGDRARLGDTPLVELDLAAPGARDAVRDVLRLRGVEAVVHLAADKRVDESVAAPVRYWRRNVGGLVALVEAMQEAAVRTLVFSSSAAVYGSVDVPLVGEDAVPRPINPYGQTKLAGEQLIAAAHRAGAVEGCSLRYFNVAGAASAALRDDVEANLIPIVAGRLGRGERPQIYGTDHPTADGTGVRDYVHVADLADAHVVVLDALRSGRCAPVYNVGSGRGHSVREVIAAVADRLGVAAEAEELPRREGDPAAVVADVRRIDRDLGWRTRFGLQEIVASAV